MYGIDWLTQNIYQGLLYFATDTIIPRTNEIVIGIKRKQHCHFRTRVIEMLRFFSFSGKVAVCGHHSAGIKKNADNYAGVSGIAGNGQRLFELGFH